MPIPAKLVTVAARNKVACDGAHWIALYGCCETDGTTLANVGITDLTNAALYPISGAATISGTPAFVSEGADAPAVRLADDAKATLWANATGSAVTAPAVRIAMRLKSNDAEHATNIVLFHSGAGVSVSGRLSVLRYSDAEYDYLRVIHRDGSTTRTYEFADVDFSESFTLYIEAGPTGFLTWAWFDGEAAPRAVQHNAADVVGMTTENGKAIEISASIAGVANGDTTWSLLGIGDVPMRERHRCDFMADPYLPIRSGPDRVNVIAMGRGPQVGRVTETAADFHLRTGTGTDGELASAAVGVRIDYAEDADGDGAARWNLSESESAAAGAIGHVARNLIVPLAGLSPDTRVFWRALYTTDGETYYPFPGGMGEFRTRREAGDVRGSAVFCTDSHAGSDSARDAMVDGVGVEPLYSEGTTPAALDSVADDIANDPPDLAIFGGDDALCSAWAEDDDTEDDPGDSVELAGMLTGGAKARDALYDVVRSCATYWAVGNHEYGGFNDNAPGNSKKRAHAIVARRLSYVNPTNGEAETSWEDADFVVADRWPFTEYPGGRAAYIAKYERDSRLALTDSPRENYFSVAQGGAEFFVIDPFTYTDVGDPGFAIGEGGSHSRTATGFTLGPTQRAWLVRALAASPAKYKLIVCHHPPCRGENGYGRVAGYEVSQPDQEAGTEMRWLDATMRAFGVLATIMGHNHELVAVRTPGSGTYWITGGTLGVPLGHIDARTGSLETQGASLASLGVLGTYTGVGSYVRFDWTADSFVVQLRQTFAAGYGLPGEQASYAERYAGPEFVVSEAKTVTLPNVPDSVQAVFKSDDLVGAWWTAAPTNYRAARSDVYPIRELRQSATIAVSDTLQAGDRVRVMWTPRTLLEFVPTRPTPLHAASAGIDPGEPGEQTSRFARRY